MTLPVIRDTLEGLEDGVAALYEDGGDGMYYLAVEMPESDEQLKGWKPVKNLLSALGKEREARTTLDTTNKALDKKLKTLPEGFTPQRWEELLQAEAKIKTVELEAKGEHEKARQEAIRQLNEQHEQERQRWETKKKGLLRSLQQSAIRAEGLRVLGSEGVQGNPRLLMPIIESSAKLEEVDENTWEVRLYNSNGTQIINSRGEPKTIEEFVRDLKEDKEFGGAFKGSAAAGTGAPGDPPTRRPKAGDLTEDQIKNLSVPEYEKARKEGRIK